MKVRILVSFLVEKMLSKQSFLIILCFCSRLTAAETLLETGENKKPVKPNIIWIVLEDISPDLGFNGNKVISTPNFDALANQGVVFSNVFATSSVCSPSRSAFFTGMYQTSIGAHNHRSHTDDGYKLPEPVRMVTEILREQGYYSLLMGPKQKTDFNFSPAVPAFDAVDGVEETSTGSYEHGDPRKSILDKAAWHQYVNKHSDKPFFAEINFSEAHREFVADHEKPINRNKVDIPPYYPDHPLTREDWALYLETIQQLDKRIGYLFAELREAGALENTHIFIFGDHGRAMLRAKQWLYDSGLKVPFIYLKPGLVEGQTSQKLVSLIDIMPTTIKLAGAEIPKYVQGKDIFDESIQRKYIYAQRDRLGATEDRIRAIRDSKFKYILNYFPNLSYSNFSAYKKLQYPTLTLMEVMYANGELDAIQGNWFKPFRPAQELYNIEEDPYEINNLAYKPEYNHIVEEMHDELMRWVKQTSDQGQQLEDPRIAERLDMAERERFSSVMRSRGLSENVNNEEYLRWWYHKLGFKIDNEVWSKNGK
jgi:N-sulfoglucosamine sulfohydrolase